MAGKTTNLQLQKIDDTDYAGNFPTTYNNNLDLIDNAINTNGDYVAGRSINIHDKVISNTMHFGYLPITLVHLPNITIRSHAGEYVEYITDGNISYNIGTNNNTSVSAIYYNDNEFEMWNYYGIGRHLNKRSSTDKENRTFEYDIGIRNMNGNYHMYFVEMKGSNLEFSIRPQTYTVTDGKFNVSYNSFYFKMAPSNNILPEGDYRFRIAKCIKVN